MFVAIEDLKNGLDQVKQSPSNNGTVELIVRRPGEGEREVLEQGELDVSLGLVGDNWLARGSRKTSDGSSHPEMQINIMNSRCIALIAGSQERWQLAGDQFFIDLDLSEENLPPGTVLNIGTAKLQITSEPHLGCKKFLERFGKEAVLFVNSDVGKQMNLRGVNAKIVQAGVVQVGDVVTKGE